MTKKELSKFLLEHEIDVQSARACVFIGHVVFDTYNKSDKLHKINYNPVAYYFSPRAGFQLLQKAKIEQISADFYLGWKKGKNNIEKYINDQKIIARKLDLLWQKYQSRKNNITSPELLKTYDGLLAMSRKWWRYAIMGEDKGEGISKQIVANFIKKHGLSEGLARDLVSTLSHPKEESVFNLERRTFLAICLEILKNKKLVILIRKKEYQAILKNQGVRAAIGKYLEKFFWTETDFYEAVVITPEHFLERVRKEILGGSLKKIKAEIRNFDVTAVQIRKAQEKIRKKVRLSPADLKDIKFMRIVAGWLDWRKLWMMEQLYYLFVFVGDVGKKYKMKYDDISLYSADEIRDLLKKNKKLSKQEMARRKRGVFLLMERGKNLKIYYGKDGRKLLEQARKINKESEIKGIVASRTKSDTVMGKVRIIRVPQKDKFNKGEILVASMTRVEYVPLMRIAKAVITNEGGIACHAAIISRELGIPCIIGTKVAMDKLKNGDVVRMDMKNGIVSKIIP